MVFLLRHLGRLSSRHAAILFVILGLAPLILLTWTSLTVAEAAVRREVEARIQTAAATSADLVDQEMQANLQLVSSYATRRLLIGAIAGDPAGPGREAIDFQVGELTWSRPGFVGAFVADPSCVVISAQPSTRAIVGDERSFRDWCFGARSTRRPYVSDASRTADGSEGLVVAAVVPIVDLRAGEDRAVLGYLAALYDLDAMRRFATRLADAQGISLEIVDKRGTLLAHQIPEGTGVPLHSRRSDPSWSRGSQDAPA
jgi:hypothetical protein